MQHDYCTACVAQNYKFDGKERDPESGLDNFGARYDNSSLGRFMTPDWAAKPTTVPYATFGDPQSLNLYSFVENGPVNRADADGHDTDCTKNRSDRGCSSGASSANNGESSAEKESKARDKTDQVKDAAQAKNTPPAPPPPGVDQKAWNESLDQYHPAGGGGLTTSQIGDVAYQETRPMSPSSKQNDSLTDAHERIADVYLNGNHTMAGGTSQTLSPQETAARQDSHQAARNAVQDRALGNDLTRGATHYNQSSQYHSDPQGRGALCPNGCNIRTSSGPFTNSNPTSPVMHWINIYD